ncbi:Cation/H+ exchanger [Dunaliella salina]|uniref:Cation/H+ exchanger n=1 Tax=Dunaliella salina TaxID=3046 RepID=A0ABQ7GUX9_DUNSA|nr:Cation/H+ exchanger [Dunaliella salina]|eukprot:KAF5838418.1 Cation/H+ exchanger [Dunaliella salina]
MLQHALVAFSIAAIVAPFSYYVGLAARVLRLPQITGYLVSGIICGPYVLGILSSESVLDLNIIEGACLSIIGLAAGAELDWPSLSRARKQVFGITAGVCLVSWLMCYLALDWTGSQFMPNTAGPHLTAAATLGATLMMARSPASAIAVLKEVDGKGPFCGLVMAVVVVKDVLVIMAFALNLELIHAVILPQGSEMRLLNFLLPLISVTLSMALGAFGGLLLGTLLLKTRASSPPAKETSTHQVAEAQQASRARQAGVLLMATCVFQVAHYFQAEPLLACVTMGMVVVNRRHERAEKDKDELHMLLAQIMSFTNVAFFGLAGASLKLSALKTVLWPALVIAAVRLVAIYIGAGVGCLATSTSPEFRRNFWLSMVTQAGVAMGLARLAGTRFPLWGPHFQTFMMSIILINLLLGPPLFRLALVRVGEIKNIPGSAASGV